MPEPPDVEPEWLHLAFLGMWFALISRNKLGVLTGLNLVVASLLAAWQGHAFKGQLPYTWADWYAFTSLSALSLYGSIQLGWVKYTFGIAWAIVCFLSVMGGLIAMLVSLGVFQLNVTALP